MFVISDRPRAIHSSDFEITRPITPPNMLHFTRSSYYYFTRMLCHQHKEIRLGDERLRSGGFRWEVSAAFKNTEGPFIKAGSHQRGKRSRKRNRNQKKVLI